MTIRAPGAPSAIARVNAGRVSAAGGINRDTAKTEGGNDLQGPRRATVHFKDGVTRRGVLPAVNLNPEAVVFEAQEGHPEKLNPLALKTIFLMLPHGAGYPEKQGNPVRVVLVDGRTLAGTTADYDPRNKAFTLFPAEDRGNIERIIVFSDAVKNIWFDE